MKMEISRSKIEHGFPLVQLLYLLSFGLEGLSPAREIIINGDISFSCLINQCQKIKSNAPPNRKKVSRKIIKV
jgi:hypothetical protein